jgi:heme A synthase
VTELDKRLASIARVNGLGRLSLLLLVSTLGVAAFWQVMYGVSLIAGIAVVGEIAVLLALAFAYAWRSSQ